MPVVNNKRFAQVPDEAWALAAVVDITTNELVFMAKRTSEHVSRHEVITNHGKKVRVIHAPSKKLKYVQRAVLMNVLNTLDFGDKAHGFVIGRGIVSNASQHLGADVVVNIDLRNFFPSITASQVFTVFRDDLGFGTKTSWLLTQVCTHDGHLPQGFPTSPALANLVALRLDRRLSALAASRGLTYTRYADDLTFSGSGGVGWLIATVTGIAKDCGFTVHPEKIAVMRKGRRQRVTGLVVNGDHSQPRVQASTIDGLRSACFNWSKQSNERRQEIRGWISFLHGVNPDKAAMLLRQIDKGQKTNG